MIKEQLKTSDRVQVRQSNLELLRIVSILLIIAMHSFTCVGDITAASGSSMSHLNHVFLLTENAIGNIGVTCFVLISGWFGIKWNLNKFIDIILIATIYHVLIYTTQSITITGLLKALFVIPRYEDWFICSYLLLMLFSPFLNQFIKSLDISAFSRLVVLLIICLNLVPTFSASNSSFVVSEFGKCFLYMIFLYMLGRYLKLYANTKVRNVHLLSAFTICTFLIIVFNYIIEFLVGKNYGLFAHDNSPFILLSGICVFIFFKNIQLQSHLINYISSSVLGIYLLNKLYLPINDLFFNIQGNAFSNILIIKQGG